MLPLLLLPGLVAVLLTDPVVTPLGGLLVLLAVPVVAPLVGLLVAPPVVPLVVLLAGILVVNTEPSNCESRGVVFGVTTKL